MSDGAAPRQDSVGFCVRRRRHDSVTSQIDTWWRCIFRISRGRRRIGVDMPVAPPPCHHSCGSNRVSPISAVWKSWAGGCSCSASPLWRLPVLHAITTTAGGASRHSVRAVARVGDRPANAPTDRVGISTLVSALPTAFQGRCRALLPPLRRFPSPGSTRAVLRPKRPGIGSTSSMPRPATITAITGRRSPIAVRYRARATTERLRLEAGRPCRFTEVRNASVPFSRSAPAGCPSASWEGQPVPLGWPAE